MAEYKAIHGFTVQNRTSDPLATGAAGATWASSGNMNDARSGLAGGGPQTAAIAFAGTTDPPESNSAETYNGSSWTEIANINTARTFVGSSTNGSQTAALCIFGSPQSGNTEIWNGTAWTEVNDGNTGRQELGGAGTSTAALAIGGNGNKAVVESWNGTSWTEIADLNTGRHGLSGTGTQTEALAVGGHPPAKNETESWNGTAWTEVNNLNTARGFGALSGSYVLALLGGGTTGTVTVNTESWDGTSWTEQNNLATARSHVGGAGGTSGGNTSNLAFGGRPPGPGTAATEEWTVPDSIGNISVDVD